jgi:hypothetical protein
MDLNNSKLLNTGGITKSKDILIKMSLLRGIQLIMLMKMILIGLEIK